MTKETIERAIAKGERRTLGAALLPVTYEVMLPGGIAMVVYIDFPSWQKLINNREAMTDNKARTAATVKNVITPVGGALSRVSYLFERKGMLLVKAGDKSFDEILEQIVNFDIEDLQEEGAGVFKVSSPS